MNIIQQRNSYLKLVFSVIFMIVLYVCSFAFLTPHATAATTNSSTTSVKNEYMIAKKTVALVNNRKTYYIQKGNRVKVRKTSAINKKTKKSIVLKREVLLNGKTLRINSKDFKAVKYKTPNEYEKEIISLVNKERKKYKLPPLILDKALTYTAYFKSKDMATLNYFNHNGGTYGTWSNLIESNSGRNIRYSGENIAYGQTTPEEVMTAWIKSPGHRANILNNDYKYIGVGVYYDKKDQYYYWTQQFLTR